MVKTVQSANHQGVSDWLVQRISALIMVIYTVGMASFFVCHPHVSYADWKALFHHDAVKIATILLLLCLLFHTWIGVWTVITDYVKPTVLSLLSQTLVILALLACFFWGIQILWGF